MLSQALHWAKNRLNYTQTQVQAKYFDKLSSAQVQTKLIRKQFQA